VPSSDGPLLPPRATDPDLPVNTGRWTKGTQVKGDNTIAEGPPSPPSAPAATTSATPPSASSRTRSASTSATSDPQPRFLRTGAGKAVGARVIGWNGIGVSNDGDPSEQVLLAPDGDQGGANTYTVEQVYAPGRIVTIRCHFGKDAVDVKLAKPVGVCRYAGDAHPQMSCK
jgi:hypothetical protein